jgi:hypothetical protein
MLYKDEERERAVLLRKQGKTYNEILEEVSVAKSTLSVWLRGVGLSKAQKQIITKKKRAAQKRGGARKREIRLQDTIGIERLCKKDIASLSERELLLIGVVLYWAEGTKQNGGRVSLSVEFANSDPHMVRLFVTWLLRCCGVSQDDIELRLHLHISHRDKEAEIQRFWAKQTRLPETQFTKTLFKRHNPKTVRHKTGDSYIGLVSVRVKRSTRLHRRIMGWIYAIIATQN